MRRILAILFFLLIAWQAYPQTYKVSIIQVIDGDTYIFKTAEGSFRVRSFGIDAPEGNQPFGKESAEFLSKYLQIEAILKVKSTDRYHRKLGTLYINGEEINLLEVSEGYAWHYKRYLSDPKYAAAQEYAKNHRLGLWTSLNPVPPWNWRKVERKEGPAGKLVGTVCYNADYTGTNTIKYSLHPNKTSEMNIKPAKPYNHKE